MNEKQFLSAWQEIIPSLRAFCLQLTSYNKEDSEDLIQEAFINAFKSYKSYNNSTKFQTWVFNIAKNKFIDDYRKRKVRATVNNRMPETEMGVFDSSFESNLSLSKFVAEDIEYAINKLDDKCREPFKLHVAGYQYDEIAKKCNQPLGTIKVRIFAARRKMWDILKDYDNNSTKYKKEVNTRES